MDGRTKERRLSRKAMNRNDKAIPVAIVTGAAKGIGRAITLALAGRGYFVYGVDVDADAGKELTAETVRMPLRFVRTDVRKERAVQRLFDKVLGDRKRIDLVVNNAGILRDAMIWNMSTADFDEVIQVNLKGVWLMCRQAARIMREQRRGNIVNIASRAWLGNAGQSNYSASKAGVVALTRVLALELGKYGVAVNAVAPGLIDTSLTRALDPAVRKRLIESQPTKKMGTPEDVAQAVLFLARGADRYINGQTIYVDGGKSIGAGI